MAAARNILLVVLSGGRADRLSCSGYDRETTPFLDQMAREGVRFTQAYTTAPRSASACASILTGLFASAHGATSESGLLPPTRRLLSEQLAAAGYRTAAFCSDSKISPATGFGRGFDRFHTRRGTGRIAGRAADYARRASDRVLGRRDAGARRTNLALLDWVGAADAPFFAFVRYDEARLRLRPPAPYDRLFMPREYADARIRAVNQDPLACLAGQTPVSSEEARILEALYDGALRYLDMRLKELVEALERLGRWEDTLLVVTADHGQLLGEHGLVVVAKGFARIFLQNAINVGLPLVIAPDLEAEVGDVLEISEEAVVNLSRGRRFAVAPLPPPRRAILEAGGLVPFTRRRLLERIREAR